MVLTRELVDAWTAPVGGFFSAVLIAFILMNLLMNLIGYIDNRKLAKAWFLATRKTWLENFSTLYLDTSGKEPNLIQTSPTSFGMVATGYKGVNQINVNLEMPQTSDFILLTVGTILSSHWRQTITFQAFCIRRARVPTVFGLFQSQSAKYHLSNNWGISKFAVPTKINGLPDGNYSLFAESNYFINKLWDDKFVREYLKASCGLTPKGGDIDKNEMNFISKIEYLVISDFKHNFPKGDDDPFMNEVLITLKVNIPPIYKDDNRTIIASESAIKLFVRILDKYTNSSDMCEDVGFHVQLYFLNTKDLIARQSPPLQLVLKLRIIKQASKKESNVKSV